MRSRRGGKPKLKTIVRTRINLARTLKSHQECPICLAKLGPRENTTTLTCKHTFHTGCINEWMKTNRTCPMCRRPIDPRFLPTPEVRRGSRRTESLRLRQVAEDLFGELFPGRTMEQLERMPVGQVIQPLSDNEKMRVLELLREISRHSGTQFATEDPEQFMRAQLGAWTRSFLM